jgi:hypothetical protein
LIRLRPAPFRLSDVFGKALHTKKLFDIHSAGTCTRCGLKGHDFGFCPFRSTRVPKEEQVPFMEDLLRMNLFDISVYAGMEPEEAKEFLFKNGEELNRRNPWRDSRRPRDNLRKNLGFWYFIGSPKNVLSWLGYGLMLRCFQAPQRLEFQNHPSCAQHLAFVEAEVLSQAKSRRFVEVSEDEIEVCNPIHGVESVKADGSTKLRVCNDNRYANGHQAHMCFRMETLERSVPAVVEPGDFLASADRRSSNASRGTVPRRASGSETIPYLLYLSGAPEGEERADCPLLAGSEMVAPPHAGPKRPDLAGPGGSNL